MKFTYSYKDKQNRRLVKIECDPTEYDNLKRFLTYNQVVREFNYRTKKANYVTKRYQSWIKGDEKNKQYLIVRYGMSIVIRSWLDNLGVEYELENDPKTQGIKIIDKWIEIFNNHPKVHKGQNQVRTAKAIELNSYGIVSREVGAGKSEIILSIAESYLEQYSGNVMLISFSSKVIDELKLRAEQYQVKSDRLKIIQPNGFMRRNESKEQPFLDFAKNTEIIIADEAHHFTAQTWKDLYDLVSPKFMYAFTGSADIDSGDELNYLTFESNKANEQSAELMSFCGEMIIHTELEVPVKVYRYYTDLTDPKEYEEFKAENVNKLGQAIQLTLRHTQFPVIIANLIRKYIPQESIVFIPELTSIETGVYLSDSLNKLGIETVYYSAQYVNSPVGKIDLPLEDLKQLARDRSFKVLIANVVGVEGIDIPNLSSIIPITGVKFKSIIQPIGRAARSDLVHCIFIFDRNNKMYNRQNQKRYETVIKKLNVISDQIIDI